MKAMLGTLSLLIVLAVLGLVAKHQLNSGSIVSLPASVTAPAAAGADAMTVTAQSRALQEQARDQVTRAMQLSADRAASADQ